MAMDGGEDMESLFEGMELTTPSQFPDSSDNMANSPANLAPRSEDNGTKAETTLITAPPELSETMPEPLDENLFSDLTIVSPVQHLDPVTHPSSSSPTAKKYGRQGSRRKKRAAVIRIGYGRHEINSLDEDEDDSVSQQSDSASQQPDSVRQASDPVQQSNSVSQLPDSVRKTSDPVQQSLKSAVGSSRLELVKAQIAGKLTRSRDLAASVTAARKNAIRKRRQGSENLRLASSKHDELEKKLEEAIEAEDFDAAERISESLAAVEKEKQALMALLRQAESECDAIESKMEEVLLSQIVAEQESASLLRGFCTDAKSDAESILEKAEAFCSEEIGKWHSCSEDVEVRKVELDIESVIVDNVRLSLNGTLEGSVEQDMKEKETLREKKEHLSDELQELLALVKAKEKEIEENDLQIEAVEIRINNKVSGYKELKASMDKMLKDVQAGLSQIDRETEALSRKKKDMDKFMASEKGRAAKLGDLVSASADEAYEYEKLIKLRETLMSYVSKTREERAKLVNIEEKLCEEVHMLQDEVFSTRELLKERSSRKSIIQQNITSLVDKNMFIEKRMPELEAEKKVAASARNFKEAGRIAGEAKSLNLEKDRIQIEIEKAKAELEKAEHEIEETIKRLQETEVLILSKEKELAISRFQRLRIDSDTAKAERSAALELSDFEEANLLLEEAQEAESEAEKLKVTCNLKEEEEVEKTKSYEGFVSMELIATLGLKKLEERAESVQST